MSPITLIHELTGHVSWGIKHILIAVVLSPVLIVIGLLVWGLANVIQFFSSHVGEGLE